jgi:hypothetical protein
MSKYQEVIPEVIMNKNLILACVVVHERKVNPQVRPLSVISYYSKRV